MQTTTQESFASEVWLITGLYHSLPGILALEDGILVFTAIGTGTYWDSGLKRIEQKCGNKNFFAYLKRNKSVQLFSVALTNIQKITFPLLYFSGGAHITFDSKKYRLSFIEPNNTKLPTYNKSQYGTIVKRNVEIIEDISHARKIGKKWKELLKK